MSGDSLIYVNSQVIGGFDNRLHGELLEALCSILNNLMEDKSILASINNIDAIGEHLSKAIRPIHRFRYVDNKRIHCIYDMLLLKTSHCSNILLLYANGVTKDAVAIIEPLLSFISEKIDEMLDEDT